MLRLRAHRVACDERDLVEGVLLPARMSPSRQRELTPQHTATISPSSTATRSPTRSSDRKADRRPRRSADVVHVVHEGRLEQSGDSRALYDAPANPVVARAVGPLQLLDADVEEGDVARTALGPQCLREVASRGARGSVLVRPEWLALVGSTRRGASKRVAQRAFHGADVEPGLELLEWAHGEGARSRPGRRLRRRRAGQVRPGVFYEGA